MDGRFFEQYSDTELQQGRNIAVITDYFGVLSYTERVDIILQTYLRLLKQDGVIFIAGPPKMSVSGLGEFRDFLNSITGIEIKANPPYAFSPSGYEIRVTGEPIEIPELEYLGSELNFPPRRLYNRTGRTIAVRK